jgi:hypothetical protein
LFAFPFLFLPALHLPVAFLPCRSIKPQTCTGWSIQKQAVQQSRTFVWIANLAPLPPLVVGYRFTRDQAYSMHYSFLFLYLISNQYQIPENSYGNACICPCLAISIQRGIILFIAIHLHLYHDVSLLIFIVHWACGWCCDQLLHQISCIHEVFPYVLSCNQRCNDCFTIIL